MAKTKQTTNILLQNQKRVKVEQKRKRTDINQLNPIIVKGGDN